MGEIVTRDAEYEAQHRARRMQATREEAHLPRGNDIFINDRKPLIRLRAI